MLVLQFPCDPPRNLCSGGKCKARWPQLSRIRIHRLWVSPWHSAHPIWRAPADKYLAPWQLCSVAAFQVHQPSLGWQWRGLRIGLAGWPWAVTGFSNFNSSSKVRARERLTSLTASYGLLKRISDAPCSLFVHYTRGGWKPEQKAKAHLPLNVFHARKPHRRPLTWSPELCDCIIYHKLHHRPFVSIINTPS